MDLHWNFFFIRVLQSFHVSIVAVARYHFDCQVVHIDGLVISFKFTSGMYQHSKQIRTT